MWNDFGTIVERLLKKCWSIVNDWWKIVKRLL